MTKHYPTRPREITCFHLARQLHNPTQNSHQDNNTLYNNSTREQLLTSLQNNMSTMIKDYTPNNWDDSRRPYEGKPCLTHHLYHLLCEQTHSASDMNLYDRG